MSGLQSPMETGLVEEHPLVAQLQPPSAATTRYDRCKRHAKFALTLAAVVLLLAYLLPALLAQMLGMLGLYLVMPAVMRHVYPTPLGLIHLYAFRLIRWLVVDADGHSASVRVPLLAQCEGRARAGEGDEEAHAEVYEQEQEQEQEQGQEQEQEQVHAQGHAQGHEKGNSWAARSGDSHLCYGSHVATPSSLPYDVHTIACLLDNYCYLIVDRSSPPPYAAALVDPADAPAVVAALTRISLEFYSGVPLRPVAILTTHHHWDHAGGNVALQKRYACTVYGSKIDQVAGCDKRLGDGDVVRVGALAVHAILTPAHTKGSLCFLIRGAGASPPALFCGDTLFCGGCGAPFEGSEEDTDVAFGKIWRRAPLGTLLFPGHEYALAILPSYFSKGANPIPETPAAYAKLCSLLWRANQLRSREPPMPTVPIVLSDEIVFNAHFAPLRRAAAALRLASRGRATSVGADTKQRSRRVGEKGVGEGVAAGSPTAGGDAAAAAGAAACLAGDGVGAQGEAVCAGEMGRRGKADIFERGGALAPSHALSAAERFRLNASSDHFVMVPRESLRSLERISKGEAPWAQPDADVEHQAGREGEGGTQAGRDAGGGSGALGTNVGGGSPEVRERLLEELGEQLRATSSGEIDPAAVDLIQQLSPELQAALQDLRSVNVATRAETKAAFALLDCSPKDETPSRVHTRTLMRALTCPVLAEKPLTQEEAADLLETIGYDNRGLVHLDDFDLALGVPEAPPEAPLPRGCVGCLRHARRFTFGGGWRESDPFAPKRLKSDSALCPRDGGFEIDRDEPRPMRHADLDIANRV